MINLLLTGAVGLLALALTVSTSTSFINFGAFTAFAFVNISVIALYWRQRGQITRNPVSWLLQPLIGLAVIVWLLTNLDINALVLGTVWLLIGFAWLLWLTRLFRREPPQMRFEETEEQHVDAGEA